ncbi:MAG: hypothetical protein IBX57_00130 [Gammaproteobacteria bacterium]|nr:hypothetical protein [Gammaproteobacteria bacterium]
MTLKDYLEYGNIISFDTYPASIIGARFEDVKVMALLDKETAKQYIDPDTLHVNVYPLLPAGSPDDPDAYQYVKLKHPNGNITVIGTPWIIPDTLSIVNKGNLTILIEDVTVTDREVILRAIKDNGYQVKRTELV